MMLQEFNKRQVAFTTSCTKYLHLALCVPLIHGLCAVAFPGRTALGSWEDRFAQPPADGVLDPKRVGDIRIGWGGYFGVEHEKVQFGVALPQVGTVIRNKK
jgi:hypothetical protein